MVTFITIVFMALFGRELYWVMRSIHKQDGLALIWHSCWIIPMCFAAKYLGILFDLIGG